jgi:hypothetical protein
MKVVVYIIGVFAGKIKALLTLFMIEPDYSTCPDGQYLQINIAECVSCPNNSWPYFGGNSGQPSSFCGSNAGYYNLRNKTMAHYSLQPLTFLKDVSGNHGELIVFGSLLTPTMFGPWTSFGAAQFQNKDKKDEQYFELPNISLLTSKFSVCTWYFTTSVGSDMRIFGFSQEAGLNSVFVVLHIKELVVVHYSGGIENAHGGTPVTDNEWQHMCLVITGENGTIYSDGVGHGFGLLNAQEPGITFDSNYIGKRNQAHESAFDGKISDFRIFNDALSTEEVYNVYNFRGDGLSPVLAIPCSAGTFSAADFSTCTQCPRGKFSVSTLATSENSCQVCKAVSFSNQSASSCTFCLPGSYSELGASVNCSLCQPGKFSSQENMQSCQNCEVGKYSNKSGSSVCINCPAGTHWNLTSNRTLIFKNATSVEECEISAAGVNQSAGGVNQLSAGATQSAFGVDQSSAGVTQSAGGVNQSSWNESAGGDLPVSAMCGAVFPSTCSSLGGATVYINLTGPCDKCMLGPVLLGNYSVPTRMLAGWLSFICQPSAVLGQQVIVYRESCVSGGSFKTGGACKGERLPKMSDDAHMERTDKRRKPLVAKNDNWRKGLREWGRI